MKDRLYYLLTALLLLLGMEIANAKTYKTGLIMPPGWQTNARFSQTLGVDLPPRWDWREKAVLPPIKNQGSCGSCWAFASTEVQEQLIAIQEGKVVALSPQELVSCDNSSYGCSGGYFSAFEYQKQKGLTYEKDFPYQAANTRCNVATKPHDYRLFEWGYVGAPNRQPTVDEIKAAIVSGGPVTATVCANSAFMNYRSGVFTGRANCQNHMIVLVGFDDATQSWVLQNSWGAAWGDKGFMKIKYGANSVAQVAGFAVYKP